MSRHHWFLLSLGYLSGLLATRLFGFPNPDPSWQQWSIFIVTIGFWSFSLFILLRKRWRRCPRFPFWVFFFLIALWGGIYFQWRVPRPSPSNISQYFNEGFRPQEVQVLGNVMSEPRITNNQRQKFWLNAQKIALQSQEKYESVTGKVYVTIPLMKHQQLYPHQIVVIQGLLYQPRSPKNPGAFDFRRYLAQEGAFSGLKGEKIIFQGAVPRWSWTKVRQRIIQTFTKALGERQGLVLSSMILGRQAVDLPPDLRDIFIKAGLAHVLAASGFHVALLLGIVVWLTRSLSPMKKLILGIFILGIYTGLTGLQPSILRATFMGVAILIGDALNRQINSLGSLGFAGIFLLGLNPLWIWDLSFQLSFLATFGLMATSPMIQQKLDFLPPKIGSMVAVPIAACLWTSPLIMYVFYSFSISVIPVNILITPLIMVLIIGGMISAAITLISPLIGSLIVQLLFWPLQVVLSLESLFSHLSFSALAVGKISLWIMLLIYGLLFLVCFHKAWQKRWKLISCLILLLILVPIFYKNLTRLQITILNAQYEPMIVIQDRGQTTVINLGNEAAIQYTLLPFLSQQGINHIDKMIIPHAQAINHWLRLKPDVTVEQFFYGVGDAAETGKPLSTTEKLSLTSMDIQLLETHPFSLQWKIKGKVWLWINDNGKDDQLSFQKMKKKLNVLLWSGEKLSPTLSRQVQSQVIIVSTPFISNSTKKYLRNQGIKLYWLQQDGAIQWTPKQGFQSAINLLESDP